MAATDAHPVPIRAAINRITFPILDADGDLVAGATGLDTEFSEDAATFADASGEATEIATASGMYYIDLIATECTGETVAVIVKSTEGKTTPLVLYPASATNPINVNVQTISDDATAADNAELFFDGTGYNAANSTVGTVTTTTTATNVTNVSAGGIVAASFGAGAIDASAIAANAIGASEIADGAIDAATFAAGAIDAAAIAVGAIAADAFAAGAIDAAAIADGAIDAATFAAGAIDAAAIATNAIDADALAADAVDEIWNEPMVETTGAPAITGTFRNALEWIFALSRNKITQTATTSTLRDDADAVSLSTSTVSDDGTTATRGEWSV